MAGETPASRPLLWSRLRACDVASLCGVVLGPRRGTDLASPGMCTPSGLHFLGYDMATGPRPVACPRLQPRLQTAEMAMVFLNTTQLCLSTRPYKETSSAVYHRLRCTYYKRLLLYDYWLGTNSSKMQVESSNHQHDLASVCTLKACNVCRVQLY